MLFASQAAVTGTISLESENATKQDAKTSSVSDASASGGSYLRFGTVSTGGGGTNPPVTTGQKCSVMLHGAGFNGNIASALAPYDNGYSAELDVRFIMPFSGYWADFIAHFWPYDGPHNFQYDPNSTDDEAWFQQYVTVVRNSITQANCGPTYIEGGSNGGAFLAKMLCRGEDFGGRIWGATIKDPVMDTGVLNCNPSSNIKKIIVGYSDELSSQVSQSAGDNYRCRSTPYQWYCNDDTTMTVERYTQEINSSGKLQIPVVRFAQNHIYNYYPIADELHIGWGAPYDWWRYYWNQ